MLRIALNEIGLCPRGLASGLLLLVALGSQPGCIEAARPCDIGGLPGLSDGSTVNPYPSMHLMSGGENCALAFEPETLDLGESQDIDLRPILRRDGFSVANTIIWDSKQALLASSIPGPQDAAASLSPGAAIQLWDLDAGVRLPFFAELDAYPELEAEERALLIRPLQSLGFGRQIGVVVTEGVEVVGGDPVASPSAFSAIRDDGDSSATNSRTVAHYRELLERLEELGVARDDLVFAWDFRTGTHANVVAPLDRVVEAMRLALPAQKEHSPNVSFSQILDTDDGGSPAGDLWREVRGSVHLPHFLWDDAGEAAPSESDHDHGWFALDDQGLPLERADAPAYFTLVVPDSLRDAPAGSAPVIIFGHGVFSSPQRYLAAAGDPNSTMELCDRLGAVCIGTEWRGLTLRDSPDALRAAMDLSRFPLVTDKLHQGVANQLAMARLMKTDFLDSEFLQSADESGSLVDPSRIHYFGISLGGIEGGTFLANSEVVGTGVLHVPGAMWATMLERSVHWAEFEEFVVQTQPDAQSRQFVYAALQLLWDPVDPINHAAELGDKNVLWQVSRGDEQVPNFTAEALVRSAGVPLAVPGVWDVFGLDTLETDSGPGHSALAQWDSGILAPEHHNRPPPEETGAHMSIRHLNEMMEQVEGYFLPGMEGQVLDVCDGPCVFDLSDTL